MKRLTFILCLAIGICAAVSLEKEIAETDVILDNPEEVPGLFEGDIDLQPGDNPFHKNAVANRKQTWANGVLPYTIASYYPSAVQSVFHKAMQEIEERTKVNGKTCIHFKPRTSEAAYVHFVTGTGCHTPVGYIGRESQVTIGHGCERQGTVMHELLHALGFWHEQSRTDRDSYVTIHPENIQAGHAGNFNKYPTGYIDMLGQPYDYGSIMHYGAYAFAVDRSKPTIVPKQSGAVIGQRTRLSDIDVKEIQILYGCVAGTGSHSGSGGFVTSAPAVTSAPPAGSDVCTFEQGLCHWTNSHSDQTNWRRHKGTTPSANTGPSTDPHGSQAAHYLYIEASGHTNQMAKLDSKLFAGGDYCVDFYYHMHGNNIGSLILNVVAGTQTYHLKTYAGDHGNQWVHTRVNAHIHTSGSFKFEIEGHTGNGYHSDIAIDDIVIHPGNC